MPGKRKRPVRKKKHPKPSLRKRQKPLETVANAKKAMAFVERHAKTNNAKFVAFTNLLSRAFVGKNPNPKVVALI